MGFRIQHILSLVTAKIRLDLNFTIPLVSLVGNAGANLQLFSSIAKNIQRPLFAVYRKACREFNVENYVHKWSKELEEQLLRFGI